MARRQNQKLKRALWSPDEDEKLLQHIKKYGAGGWSSVPKMAGINRCGKSCRLRWINYLRPDLRRGSFTEDEQRLIMQLHQKLGNRWSQIAIHLPGRSDNEIKNFWNCLVRRTRASKTLTTATDINMINEINKTNTSSMIINAGHINTAKKTSAAATQQQQQHQFPFLIQSSSSNVISFTSNAVNNPNVSTTVTENINITDSVYGTAGMPFTDNKPVPNPNPNSTDVIKSAPETLMSAQYCNYTNTSQSGGALSYNIRNLNHIIDSDVKSDQFHVAYVADQVSANSTSPSPAHSAHADQQSYNHTLYNQLYQIAAAGQVHDCKLINDAGAGPDRLILYDEVAALQSAWDMAHMHSTNNNINSVSSCSSNLSNSYNNHSNAHQLDFEQTLIMENLYHHSAGLHELNQGSINILPAASLVWN